MSATPPPCSRCSASASRCGRCTPCSSPTIPATAPGAAAPSAARRSARWSRGSTNAACSASATACISGYLGSADIGEAVVDTVGRVKGANPAARYCCDPVIGDVGRGVFVRRGVPELIRERALPIADFVTPNQFELDFLTARTTATLAEALAADRRAACAGAAGGAGHLAAARRYPGRRPRPRRIGRHRPLPAAHPAAAADDQRRRRR